MIDRAAASCLETLPAASSRARRLHKGCGCVASELLFQGARELLIEHQGETYRLRITRNEKLILTK